MWLYVQNHGGGVCKREYRRRTDTTGFVRFTGIIPT